MAWQKGSKRRVEGHGERGWAGGYAATGGGEKEDETQKEKKRRKGRGTHHTTGKGDEPAQEEQ